MPTSRNTEPDETAETLRMSFGDHLEELRKRVIWSLYGLVVSTCLCYYFGETINSFLTAPYKVAMEELGFDPRMVQLNPIESFMEYFKIALKFGILFAAPWILYQLWKFVAAGLYSTEQRIIKLFAPASIILFAIGASFMVVVVLAGLMNFLIGFSRYFPLPGDENVLVRFLRTEPEESTAASQPARPPTRIPVIDRDPTDPDDGQIWFNAKLQRLNIHEGEETYYLRFQKSSAQQFVQPFFSIAEYLGFVVNLALSFGLGFQIPIVVIFLIAIRIVPSERMSASRKYVILGVAILAAILTPTPDVGTMMLLAVPMILLFEAGLFIGRIVERRRAETSP